MLGSVVICSIAALFFLVLVSQGNCRETGIFVHITDIHYDHKYKEGSKLEPKEPPLGERIGCRTIDPSIPKNQTAGKFGALGGFCDIPKVTVESALDFIANLNPKPDFVLYSGDNDAHDWLHQTPHEVIYAMGNVSQAFKKHVYPIPVFPIIGNHESFPIDEFSIEHHLNSWLMGPNYNYWIDLFGKFIDEESKDVLKKYGYYTGLLAPGLRILAFNSMCHMRRNIWVKFLPASADPFGQVAFIEKTLAMAQKNGEKVLILGHVPPTYEPASDDYGTEEFLDHFLKKFTEFTNKYSSIIVGQLYGHTHTHSFAISRNETTKEPKSVVQITSSLTTWNTVNPGFRVFVYDKKDFTLLDSIYYYTDLKKSNERGTLVWEKLGALSDEKMFGDSFTKFGGLTPQAFDDFAKRMETNDKGAWNAYATLYNAGATFEEFEDKKKVCRRVCSVSFTSKEDFTECTKKCPK